MRGAACAIVRAAYYLGAAEALASREPTAAAEHLLLAGEALRTSRRERNLRDHCAVIEVAIAKVAARLELPDTTINQDGARA